MGNGEHNVRLRAIDQFRSARLQAKVEQIRAALTGKSADLLSYEDVREKVHAIETNKRELKMVPLDAIVGSVGRYNDFTRHFFPLVEKDQYRWARVHTLTEGLEGLPPIEVYQMGEVYFVRDGNHRVSVARDLEATQIEAYVTQVESPVPLDPDIQPDDLIIKERYARFLALTHLVESFPILDLSMSAAGNYRVLEQQIRVHQHWLQEEQGEGVSFSDAAGRWYEEVYWPVILLIRERGLMRDFPQRTETDLYVWIDKHRHDLADRLGWSVDAETAVRDLVGQQTPSPREKIQRVGQKLREAVTPAALAAGPAAGEWRESWLATFRQDRLFSHILVAIDGQEAGWQALQQALLVAKQEEGNLFGLHVVATPEAANSEAASALQAEFERRCQDAGLPGKLSITTGPPTDTICYRAHWADLVVVSLSHPPGPRPVDRLGSQFGQLLRRCSRPVLAVPRRPARLDRILLAYDGSPKADEALYVTAYLAGQWQVKLTVVVALGKGVTADTTARAQAVLEGHHILAEFVVAAGAPASLILKTAQAHDCGLICMGGYGPHPMVAIVAGSVVDEVLRSRNRPVLVCR